MKNPLTSPVLIYTARSNLDAHLVSTILNHADIPAHVVEDVSNLGMDSQRWAISLIRPQVFVDETQVEAARELLKDYDPHRSNAPPERYCYHCGVELEGNSAGDHCPHCGAELEDQDDEHELETVSEKRGCLPVFLIWLMGAWLLSSGR